jgi:hypothetical protein
MNPFCENSQILSVGQCSDARLASIPSLDHRALPSQMRLLFFSHLRFARGIRLQIAVRPALQRVCEAMISAVASHFLVKKETSPSWPTFYQGNELANWPGRRWLREAHACVRKSPELIVVTGTELADRLIYSHQGLELSSISARREPDSADFG